MKIQATLKKLNPNDSIPPGALHSLDGKTFRPIFNSETIGQKVKEFDRDFYVIIDAVIDPLFIG